jgi:hypothetical protein
MEQDFTVNQLYKFAVCIEKRFKANQSLFKLADPPRHTVEIATSPTITVSFNSQCDSFFHAIVINSTPHGEYYSGSPSIFRPILFIKHRIASRKLWRIAESLLHSNTNNGDKLLYDLFPEMLEKDLRG